MTQLKTQTEYLKFALKNGQLVSIDEVPNGNDCGCQCPACGKDLCARNNGTKRIHHFAHQSGADCPGAVESSIHLLAKKVIKERFYDAGKSFLIQFVRECKCCNYETCQFADEYGCKKTMPIGPFDLKEHYDTCEEEVPEGDFRPDLLLMSSKHHDDPIYIEVFYKHKCEENKLKSGKRIIEIKVKNEKDVLALGTQELFEESYDYFEGDKYYKSSSNFTFHNFEPREITQEPLSDELPYYRFVLYGNGSAYCGFETIICNNKQRAKYPSSQKELLLEYKFYALSSPYHCGLVYLLDKGFDVKNCQLCSYCHRKDMYDGGNICALYKKCQTPKNPLGKEANSCSHYTPKATVIEEARNTINSGIKIIEIK